jgi:hypothetical protein
MAATPKARFTTEEQFCDGGDRAVVRWRYDWGDGQRPRNIAGDNNIDGSPEVSSAIKH